MNGERHFNVFCLILYAIFQFYQAYSAFFAVFIDSKNYEFSIKLLTAFQIFGFITSSVLLILGSLKRNGKLILCAMPVLIYKVAFFLWHLKRALEITILCESAACDRDRLLRFYQHIFIFRKKVLRSFFSLSNFYFYFQFFC